MRWATPSTCSRLAVAGAALVVAAPPAEASPARAVELAAGPHGSYQEYNGADDFTVGGWASGLHRIGGDKPVVALGARGSFGWMEDPISEQPGQTRIYTGTLLSRASLCRRWVCVGAGLELGLTRVTFARSDTDATTRVKGLLGLPVTLTLGTRRPFAFVLEAGPRLRLGSDFGGQVPGDGGYKTPVGLLVGLGLAYTFDL